MLRDASETLQGIVFFVTMLGGAAVTAVTLWRGEVGSAAMIVMCAAVFVLAAATIGFWYYLKHVAEPATYRILDLVGELEVESVGDHHRFRYTMKQRVRALRNGVSQIDANAHWTGRSSESAMRLEPLVSDHAIFDGGRPEDDGRRRRWIYASTPMA